MGSISHRLLFTFVALISGTVFHKISLASGVKTLDDRGWSPISPSDPAMVDLAKFAVKAHNEQPRDDLVFDSLVGGQSTNYPCPTYNMILTAKGGDQIVRKYFAQVSDRPYMNSLRLIDWNGPL